MPIYHHNPFSDDGFDDDFEKDRARDEDIRAITAARCHDRMCGALDCLNCHPENFKNGQLICDPNEL